MTFAASEASFAFFAFSLPGDKQKVLTWVLGTNDKYKQQVFYMFIL